MRTSDEIQIEIDERESALSSISLLKKEREQAMLREWNEFQQRMASEAIAIREREINRTISSWVAIDQMLDEYGDVISFLWSSYGEAHFLDSFKTALQDAGYVETNDDRERREYKENPYRKKKINGTIRVKVFERDGYQCVHCGVRKDLSLDHIHPESKGGTATIENLQTLCRSCNSKKGVSL